MSKPIDINKATLEELTSITGIGEKRAQKILNKKARKGIRPHPAGFETHDRYTKHNMGSLD
jgi:predicted DNA-binding helix-hairpin-helix protein